MENTAKDKQMLDTVLKVVGIIVSAIGTLVKIVDMLQNTKDKHQKSNREKLDQSQVAFLMKVTINRGEPFALRESPLFLLYHVSHWLSISMQYNPSSY